MSRWLTLLPTGSYWPNWACSVPLVFFPYPALKTAYRGTQNPVWVHHFLFVHFFSERADKSRSSCTLSSSGWTSYILYKPKHHSAQHPWFCLYFIEKSDFTVYSPVSYCRHFSRQTLQSPSLCSCTTNFKIAPTLLEVKRKSEKFLSILNA